MYQLAGYMELSSYRNNLKQVFKQHNIEVSDVDIILSHVLKIKKTELIFVNEIDKNSIKKVNKMVKKRLKHKPIDKIIKKAYFYRDEFIVNQYVLTPRSDSEILIEEALKIIENNRLNSALDMCTGSGCLAITLAKYSNIEIDACDISKKALKIAKKNAKKLKANVKFLKSDMFKNINKKYDLIVSNPPYIKTEEINFLDEEVKNYDPILALDGGIDGLKFYRIINENAKKYLNKCGYLILEIGDTQLQEIITLFKDYDYIKCLKDYGGHDRVVVLKKGE